MQPVEFSQSGRDELHVPLSPLLLLIEARACAEDLQRDGWDFAVELETLERNGLTRSSLRWLVGRRYVIHGYESQPRGGQARTIRPSASLHFNDRSCFLLTAAGLNFLSRHESSQVALAQSMALRHASIVDHRAASHELLPVWDQHRRELHLGSTLVKRFKVPAPNQTLILAAFQEESWPLHIDDPLPPHPDQDAKRRLHDTINALNRHQVNALIRFKGDGCGKGIRWELVL